MRVAITGTPGTGKTTTCRELSRQGHVVVDLAALAKERGLVEPPSHRGAAAIVDVERLKKVRLPRGKLVFISSHFSHLLRADKVIVLRCSPKVLRGRLESRGWRESKIIENLEAEAIDLITVESIERHREVYEVDTTSSKSSETARQIIEIVRGAVKGHEPGHVDWSKEILSWY